MTAPPAHHALLDRLASDPSGWSRPERVGALGDLERLRSWLDAREAALLAVAHREADDVNSGARDLAQLCQKAGRVGYGDAKRRARRAHRLPDLPATEGALVAGRLGSAQADEMCGLAERLEPDQLRVLAQHEDALVAELHDKTPAQARKRLARFEQDLQDDDGTAKLERQRAKSSHRERKHGDGASTFFTHLDPVAASQVRACIDRKVEQLWRGEHADHDGPVPPGALSDERLRAQAMVELIRAGHAAPAGTRGHADVLVLIDYQTLLGQLSLAGRCELGDGTPLPASEVRRLACQSRIIPIVMGGSSLPLDVGRSSRLATAAQRAAARAVHDTCCIAGCDTPFDYCELHHITWWSDGGRSDLANLAPVCSKHHHLIHDHGWELRLDRRRVGTLQRGAAAPDRSNPRAGANRAAAMRSGEAGRGPVSPGPFESQRDDSPPPPRSSGRRPARPDHPDRKRATTIPPDAAMAPNRC
jgi:hypothetical protein